MSRGSLCGCKSSDTESAEEEIVSELMLQMTMFTKSFNCFVH